MIPVSYHFRGAPKTRIYYFLPVKIIAQFAGVPRPVNPTESSQLSQTGRSKRGGIPTTRISLQRPRLTGRLLSRRSRIQAPKQPKPRRVRIKRLTVKISLQRHRHNPRLRRSHSQRRRNGWSDPLMSPSGSAEGSFPQV